MPTDTASTRHGVFDIAEFKAIGEDNNGDRGRFSALVSVFGNTDLGGDRVVKGAFTNTLNAWRESGDPIPVIWSHDWGNPNAHIGAADPNSVKETAKGLVVEGRLDLDNPFAAQVYRLLKERRVKEMSFGYRVQKAEPNDDAYDLHEVDLIEVGPTLKGMNPDTQLLGVKADLEAAAKKSSTVDDRPRDALARDVAGLMAAVGELTSAVAVLSKIFSSIADGTEKPDEAEADDGAAADETDTGKSTVDTAGKASDPELLSLMSEIHMLRG